MTKPLSSLLTGRKKSRCRTVWVKTNARRRYEATAANASWERSTFRPCAEVVKLGGAGGPPAGAITVDGADPVPEH